MSNINGICAVDTTDPLSSLIEQLVEHWQNPAIFYARNMIRCGLQARRLGGLPNCKTGPSTPANIGAGVAKYGTAALSTVTGLAGVGALGGTAAATGAAGGSIGGISAAAIAGPAAIAILPFAVWGIIAAHHGAAVAKEQSVTCNVENYVNSNNDAIIQAVIQNAIDWKTAKGYFNEVRKQALSALAPISQNCNAGCAYGMAINALEDFLIAIYAVPSGASPITPQTPEQTAKAAGYPSTSGVNAQGGAKTAPEGSGVLIAAASAVGLHFVGAF